MVTGRPGRPEPGKTCAAASPIKTYPAPTYRS